MLRGRFFKRCLKRLLEPPMNAMLAVALVTACMVNMACLLTHL